MASEIVNAILSKDDKYLRDHLSDLELLAKRQYSNFLHLFQTEVANFSTPEIVSLLLPLCRDQDIIDSCLVSASGNNSLEVVDVLLTKADPKTSSSRALSIAASYGRLDIVERLLPLSEPKANDSNALVSAVMGGHYDVVRFLLPRSDASANKSWPLALASEHGYKEICDLLYPFSNCQDALEHATSHRFSPNEKKILEDYMRVETERKEISEAVDAFDVSDKSSRRLKM